jgi:molecular chaperone DnaK (HSP70)
VISHLRFDAGTSQKVPTLISYDNHGIQWGYQVDDMKAVVRGVKLLLDKGQTFRYAPAVESERIIQGLGKEPVGVSGEYMRMMVSHAKQILDRRGIGNFLDTLDVQYILTIPGVWSDKAKSLTIEAAYLAGIPRCNLSLLSEPEAGAVYAIRTIQPNSMAVCNHQLYCENTNAL